jgi:hypothetical protein
MFGTVSRKQKGGKHVPQAAQALNMMDADPSTCTSFPGTTLQVNSAGATVLVVTASGKGFAPNDVVNIEAHLRKLAGAGAGGSDLSQDSSSNEGRGSKKQRPRKPNARRVALLQQWRTDKRAPRAEKPESQL